MDEWTGLPDNERIDVLADALASTIEPMSRALKSIRLVTEGG